MAAGFIAIHEKNKRAAANTLLDGPGSIGAIETKAP